MPWIITTAPVPGVPVPPHRTRIRFPSTVTVRVSGRPVRSVSR